MQGPRRKPGLEPGAGEGGRGRQEAQGPLYSEELGLCFVGKEVAAYEVFSKEYRTIHI